MTLGPDLLFRMTEKVKLIRDCLKVAQDRKKSYSDLKRRSEEFTVGKRVLLRVSPMRRVVRFGARGKLSPRFIVEVFMGGLGRVYPRVFAIKSTRGQKFTKPRPHLRA